MPSPGDLPNPGIELGSTALQVDSLPTELSEKHQGSMDSGLKPCGKDAQLVTWISSNGIREGVELGILKTIHITSTTSSKLLFVEFQLDARHCANILIYLVFIKALGIVIAIPQKKKKKGHREIRTHALI